MRLIWLVGWESIGERNSSINARASQFSPLSPAGEGFVIASVRSRQARRFRNACLHPSAKLSVTPTVGLLFDCRNVSFEIQLNMIEIRETEEFKAWFKRLRDRGARSRIEVRVRRLSLGNPGDVNAVGEGVSELRIDYGPGYRVYFVRHGDVLIFLLAGGDKRTQDRDIKLALELAKGV